MRAVIQRVSEASVAIAGEVVARIGTGLLVLVGVETGDSTEDAHWLAGKIAQLRIFADDTSKMNLSVVEADGGMLVVSQFTLVAATAKGNRPSFIRAARPEEAVPLYELFLAALEPLEAPVKETDWYWPDGRGMPVEKLLERVKKRGRAYERQINETYLNELSKAYSEFFYYYYISHFYLHL